MCGIVGYIGAQDAYPILIKGLRLLEYRGYDSAGVALLNPQNKINVYKRKGKVQDLAEYARDKDLSGRVGIAHTRWATHGIPSTENAHPHLSQNGRLAIVHNGIIENYRELKEELTRLGYRFESDTDSEVLGQYIEYMHYTHQLSIEEAVREALKKVVGAYAIAVIDCQDPDLMVVARMHSPLAIGIPEGMDRFIVASDASPIIPYTNRVIFLNDGETALLRPGKEPVVRNLSGETVPYAVTEVNLSASEIGKEGFPHYMLKEIADQPRCLRQTMQGRITPEGGVELSAVQQYAQELQAARRIIIVGCGTSWHAALVGKQLIERLARIPVRVEYASEFRYSDPIIYKDDVVIALSQSGETADTLAAVRIAKERGAFVYGICNSIGSTIARAAHTGTYIHVGPEIGVASTKAFTGQLTVLTLLALALGRLRETLPANHCRTLASGLQEIPDLMEKILEQKEEIRHKARLMTFAQNALYLGRSYQYPVALEGALKLKEISYIHAEGYPTAEMKHGPIALIDGHMPSVVLAMQDDLYDKVIANIREIKARSGFIMAVVNEGDTAVSALADITLEVPHVAPELQPLLSVVPLQLFAYYVAVGRGLEVDQPRNLAKSVTVE